MKRTTKILSSRREAFLLLLILVLGFSLRMSFLHEPFDRDEGVYAYIGQEILRGGLPYRDVLDIKPPGIYYIYAMGIALFGETTEAIRIFTACCSLLTVVGIFLLARLLGGPRASLCAALLFSIYSSAPHFEGNGSNSEVFMILPLVASAYFLLISNGPRRRLFLSISGLSAGVALLIKTVALPQVIVLMGIALYPFPVKWRLKDILDNALCFILPMFLIAGGILAYFGAHGALEDFLYWNIVFPRKYFESGLNGPPWTFVIPNILPEFLLLMTLALPTAFYMLLKKRNRGHLLVLLWIGAAYLGVILPGKNFPHYYIQYLPPLSIAAGIGLGELFRLQGRDSFAALLLVAGFFLYSVFYDYKFYLVYTPEEVSTSLFGPRFVHSTCLARYIRARTLPSDYIYQWGMAMELYFLSGRRSPNRFTSNLLIKWSREPQLAVQEMTQSIARKRPKYLYVDSYWANTTGWEELKLIIKQDYQLEKKDNYGLIYKREQHR
jgi:4-amino-4-deoxy-L-arabinose transferase-like glycosyltransferase